ncbi:uncharacterized protein LOC122027012 isoform X2 [Zingiber officinale]|uniref:uncharacterized protein LOC122027012 isoform X2 n=1 Tax=Zingiber officinale TaxID=94328 RepID=UPI001C4ABCEB|nr:uncharacterized protein LOC122027012 isoform X2 [Zingiber officinale]
MAFHIACPLTCRRICDCDLGFDSAPRREALAAEIDALEEFLRDPWAVRPAAEEEEVEEEEEEEGEKGVVQVWAPRVAPPAVAAPSVAADDAGAGDEVKRAVLQRQALAASLAAEDYVRRLETGGAAEAPAEAANNLDGEYQGNSAVKVMCRVCFSGEHEGTEKALKMLSCKSCNKKYHRSCLKTLSEHRDLFDWSSWSCPSCRICEICRRTGDPNKLMYCKRCDGAYHCYCQRPPHKNVGRGPYLCPKHTRCHSCGSSVPGSGPSTRWFLGYTCCDACGRLFVKGNYCPICLKVYRDSETIPMVCCDICERWVHCLCDGISDEKYQEFQADQNLQYQCAACRGDCYQVTNIDDAVKELWKRRDIADCDLIASLREAAGLPSKEEINSNFPYLDNEQIGPILHKNDSIKSLKFSLKGINDKFSKEHEKIVSNKMQAKKMGYQIKLNGKTEDPKLEGQNELTSLERSLRNQNVSEINSFINGGSDIISSSALPKLKIKSSKSQGLRFKECSAKSTIEMETTRSTKLVIHIGSKNKIPASSSPRSETSSCHMDQDLITNFGGDDAIKHKVTDSEDDHNHTVQRDTTDGNADNHLRSSNPGSKENSPAKRAKVNENLQKINGGFPDECQLNARKHNPSMGKKRNERSLSSENETIEQSEDIIQKSKRRDISNKSEKGHSGTSLSKFTSSSCPDTKPFLKLKFKSPYFEQKSSWTPTGDEENSVKGQRSTRKRPSTDKNGWMGNEKLSKLHLGI